ncbi:MAG: MFS transporter [Flavobacteriales bacterium]
MKEKRPALNFSGYQKFIVFILAFLQFTIVLDFMIISPLGDTLIKDLAIGTKEFGLVVSSYAFSAGISGILAAGFADRFDRKKLLLFFYTGFLIGTLFCGLATSYQALMIARVITGLFGGVIGSIVLAIIADLFDLNQRGRVMGFVQMAFAGSQILGIPFGIYISNVLNWHYTFIMIVVVATAVLAVVIFKMKPITAHLDRKMDKHPVHHLWHTLKNPTYRIGFTATTFLAIGGFMIMPFSTPFLINNIHISKEELPLLFMFTGISSMIIMPTVGRISDRVDKYKVFAFGSVVAMVLMIIYANLPVIPLWEMVIINIFLFIGIMSRMVPATSLNTSMPEIHDRGAYMSITASLQQMAGGLGAVIAGFIVHQETEHSPIENFPILGYVVAGIILITILLMKRVDTVVKKKLKPTDVSPPQTA